MVRSGASAGNSDGKSYLYVYIPKLYVSQKENDSPYPARPKIISEPLDELLRFQFVEQVYGTDDHFQVLPKGLSGLTLMQTAVRRGSVFEYTRASVLELPPRDVKNSDAVISMQGMTRWELQMILKRNGWKDTQSKVKKVLPTTKNMLNTPAMEKQYFYDCMLGKDYLLCIVLLDRLFSHGLAEFHHFQPQNYYSVLIDSLQFNPDSLAKILPNQPMAFYKEHKTRNHDSNTKRGAKRKQTSSSCGLPEGFEVEETISMPPPPVPAALQKARARGKGRGGRGEGRARGRTVSEQLDLDDDGDEVNLHDVLIREDEQTISEHLDLDDGNLHDVRIREEELTDFNLDLHQPEPTSTTTAYEHDPNQKKDGI